MPAFAVAFAAAAAGRASCEPADESAIERAPLPDRIAREISLALAAAFR
jgi:hypothetical protein